LIIKVTYFEPFAYRAKRLGYNTEGLLLTVGQNRWCDARRAAPSVVPRAQYSPQGRSGAFGYFQLELGEEDGPRIQRLEWACILKPWNTLSSLYHDPPAPSSGSLVRWRYSQSSNITCRARRKQVTTLRAAVRSTHLLDQVEHRHPWAGRQRLVTKHFEWPAHSSHNESDCLSWARGSGTCSVV
jgi:hypothetical protein